MKIGKLQDQKTYIFLLNNSWIKLEINMLDSLQIDTAHVEGVSIPVYQFLSGIQDLGMINSFN